MKKSNILLMASLCLLMTACNDQKTADDGAKKETSMAPSESKQERNKKIIMASMENFNKGDLDATFKETAADFVEYADGSIPPIKNLDSLKAFIGMMRASIDGYKGENLQYYADGDHVIVYGDWGGTFNKDMMGIKATHKPVKFKDTDIFKFNEEGKVTEHYSVQNLGAVLMAAGMMK